MHSNLVLDFSSFFGFFSFFFIIFNLSFGLNMYFLQIRNGFKLDIYIELIDFFKGIMINGRLAFKTEQDPFQSFSHWCKQKI